MPVPILLGLAPWLAGGCGSSTPESSFCEADLQYERAVDLNDNTLGYSALDIAAAFAANGDGLLHWYDGGQTVLHITSDASQGTVSIIALPDDPKYCAPSMSVDNVAFTVFTDDGRLAESMVSSLAAVGRGSPTAVWPALAVRMTEIRGTLQLPTDWTEDYEVESVQLTVNSKVDTESPYCHPDEVPDLSTTSTSECTLLGGKVIQWGRHWNGDPAKGQLDSETVNHVVGWWNWL